MKVYVHDPDSYIGRALYAAIKVQLFLCQSVCYIALSRSATCDKPHVIFQAQGVQLSDRQASHLSVEIEDAQQSSDATVMQSDVPPNAESLPETASVDEPPAYVSVSAESSEHTFSVEEPNVFIYTLSVTGDSVQQALAALKKQVGVFSSCVCYCQQTSFC